MNINELYWAAGFLEGEGYFCLRGGKKKTTPGILASQVQREPLERLLILFGGKIYGPYSSRHTTHSPFYRWDISSTSSIEVMMTLYKLMSTKRKEEIRKVISAWKVSPGNSSVWIARGFCKNGHDLTGSNYVVAPSGHGRCRQCGIEGRRRYYSKNKEKWRGYAARKRA